MCWVYYRPIESTDPAKWQILSKSNTYNYRTVIIITMPSAIGNKKSILRSIKTRESIFGEILTAIDGWDFSIGCLFKKFQANFPWHLNATLLEKQLAHLFPSRSAPLEVGFRFRSVGRVPLNSGINHRVLLVKQQKWFLSKPTCSPVAQLAEQVAVNHWVRGSSPCWGAIS